MNLIRTLFIAVTAASLLSTVTAYAHISVKPDTVVIASYQNFTVSVPVEKEIPTTEIRLMIPGTVSNVTPNVKPGWKVETKKATLDGEEKVTEIIWTGGSIPDGQRDEFIFSAKTPAAEGTLIWKVYQTYSDGSVVSWDIENVEHENGDDETKGPASITKVIKSAEEGNSYGVALWVSFAALLAALYAVYSVYNKRK